MTLPTTGNLGLLQARAEFGLGPGSLSELRRAPNGAVPDNATNAGVPQNLPIGLRQLLGAQNYMAVAVTVDDAWIGPIPLNRPAVHEYLQVEAKPSGGSADYTYTWTFVSGNAGTSLRAGGNPASFMALGSVTTLKDYVASFYTDFDTWSCTVTDGVSTATTQFNITVEREVASEWL